MKISLLYFGRPRERLGLAREIAEMPEGATTLADLLAWLRLRGDEWAHELAEQRVRCAINQVFAASHSSIKPDDEIAIFSPISGG